MPDTTPFDTLDEPTPDAAAARLPRPRIRIGAALWGLVLVALAATTIWISSTPARRDEALAWVLGLTPLGWSVIGVVTVGGVIALLALAAVIRRAQKRRS
ncbi:hypothetical protein [Protaetiibacter larvae]|uniref:Uncharacterized protein n=1 Tax=Protaetiibacter larvae TaxID=2592654 RepID=A0A5C1Y4G9_9MICO|nr:hypothetical protein [Protaetiibacter larvae]QEO08774.1 hypothetical protein FLP23_01310 [Protaetiibacter larvae]